MQEWANEVRKLQVIDGLNKEQIQFIFDYTAQHDFWQNQIMSVKKFRQKNKEGVPYFVVIIGEMKKQSQYPKIADLSN